MRKVNIKFDKWKILFKFACSLTQTFTILHMKTTLKSLLLAALALIPVSCLKNPVSETNASLLLKSDISSIAIPADLPGTLIQEKKLTITCNRSWSAFLEPESDWVTLSLNEFENIARTEETAEITLSFTNNENRMKERSANLVVSTAEGRIKIPVKQDKQVPYINLITPARVEDISCMEEVYVVKFGSNIKWKASIEEGSTASVTLDKENGQYDSEISVTFAENTDTDITPEAVLVLDGEEFGLDSPVRVYFKQGQAEPYIKWLSEDATYIGSLAGSMTLQFKTNSPWTASLEESAGGFSLSATEGSKDVTEVTVIMEDFYGVGRERSATAVLSLENGTSAKLVLKQLGTGIFLDFSGGNQPFTTEIPHAPLASIEPVLIKDLATEYTYTLDGNDYIFEFYSGSGFALIDAEDGKTCGIAWVQASRATGQGSWIKLPSVQGKTLTQVRAYTSNMGSSGNKRFIIGDEQPTSTTVPSKEHNRADVTVPANSQWAIMNIRDASANETYWMVAGNGSIYFSKLYLEYGE